MKPAAPSEFKALCGAMVLVMVCGVWGNARLQAQTATNPVVPKRPGTARLLPPPVPEPVPMNRRSPVEFFRELLVMTPEERLQALKDKPSESRKQILAKVREYLAYRPEQRELRLQVTELRWYLWPLMWQSATNRVAQLAWIPGPQRSLVADRLREWDQLPAAVQNQLRENEATLRYFTELSSTNTGPQRALVNSISEVRRQKLEEGMRQFQAMPESERQALLARFNRFFELTPAEKVRTLSTLSEAERREIDKTLRQYNQLNPQQRQQCVQSFEKFTRLSLEEREQFLKNAEHWKLMSPEEREAWRQLVARLQGPPMPPTSPMRVARPSAVATNRN